MYSIKETDKSMTRVGSLVPSMNYDPSDLGSLNGCCFRSPQRNAPLIGKLTGCGRCDMNGIDYMDTLTNFKLLSVD